MVNVTSLVRLVYQADPDSNIGALGSIGLGGLALVFAAGLEGLLARALWKLKNWARIATIALSALGIVSLVRDLFEGYLSLNTLSIFWTMLCFVIDALIIWYLLKPDVAAVFRRNEAN